ncbi:MAG: Lrp/AsnC family transcriptional regulator [Rhodospirillaceae bacterium]|jgi:Lrp/AsnC family transcriptional regulator|nr:Lrp/AsnC family transcriptional regulator [Rhodospirillaceae bacterium]MBT4689072.1 Lrp/AsnC family transcriptional regulator [Rhodospirillaceae bacterium]MBT5082103.1 Lrp/AsnC family transcriptional regulator [Rhodospirillaceae bacterium]MBT5523576.1 Lrp/AsnC family transcriptional regulator [Rhodospirillaceae bacterium]MBT5879019.1 Lrp/AsnC family transcriptional regulator [Rhodospirillaceae bacterium]
MDDFDYRILHELQEDASLAVAVVAERVGLSPTPCWRRIQKLEANGVIRARVALLDAAQLDLGLTVFVHLRIARHGTDWLDQFTAGIMAMEEVLEVNRLAGNWDYLLRVLVADMPAYDEFYKRLIEIDGLNDVSSSFSMQQIKYTTALPLKLI